MNHIKSIINTNIPCRSPSNIRITTNHSSYKSEVSIKKRYMKPRSPKIGNSFMLVMKQIHPNQEFIQSTGIRSKSIGNLIKNFLSDRKLPLRCNFVKNVNPKKEMNYSNNLCYDCNINYEGDRETRSYAQMITAYNNTMMMVDDNSSNMIRDKLKSKMNVRLSKTTHFRTTSTLSSSAYNFENFTIKENSKETSMTDLPVDTSFDHSVEIDNDFDDKYEKRKDLEIRKSKTTTIRSYANIIADYSAAMNGDFTSKKSENYLSKLSMISSSPENFATPETSDFVLSRNLNTDSRKEININEEIDWLSKVDKVIKNLKSATAGKDKKIDKEVSNLEETNVLQCVKIDEVAKVDKMKSTETTPRKISFPGDNKKEEGLKHCKGKTSYGAEKVDGIKMVGQCLSSDYKFSTSSNVNSTFGKKLTQMPSNTESNISNDPQVELRMVPSGNESIVSVNVESIARTTEPRNPSSKELSVVVSSNNKQHLSNMLATNLRDENQSKFGSMRISISEESLPVKELELFVNGKPISDVRSIKARTETLNVLTSMDKVEIRVPYSQDNPNTLNQNTRNFVKNVSNPEPVLKLRIATAFDEINPIVTSGDKKKVQQISTDLESKSSKKKSTRIEESNFNVIMSELSSTIKNTNESNIEKVSAIKIEKSDEVNVKKTFKRDTIQERQTPPVWIKSENDSLKRANTSTFTSVHDDVKKHEITSDIDLRFTKIFGSKGNVKNNLNVKQDDSFKPENVSSSRENKSVGNESYKRANLSTKDNVRSLEDIMIKHSGRSSDGNSSAISGKPKPGGSNQMDDQKSSKSDKHDAKTTDAITKKFVLNNQSSKSDRLDERVSPKQSPRLSDVKSKKEEDYQRNYSTPTYVTNKQKSTQSNRTLVSNDKIQSKLKVDSLDEKISSTKWNKPSIEIKSSKAEKQYDTKDSKTFSKVPDVEKTSKSSSTFKSENVRITRDDFFLFNDETTSRSSSSPVKIVEFEKFDKRNEVYFKREAKNVGTSKETENMKKSGVQIQTKNELPKSDVVGKNIDTKINESQRNVDNVKNEKFVSCKLTSFEEKSNVRANEKKDSSIDLEKQNKSINDSKDTKMKNIINSMKPIEKKKDGILIDYGVKVASRKKQEKTKSPRKDLTTNENNPIVTKINEKIKEKENQCLNNRDEIKTIRSTPVSIQNSIKDNRKKHELKATNETKSLKYDDVKEKHLSYVKKDIDSKAVNSNKINNESLNVKLSKTLDKLKENLLYQNVRESQQSNIINYSTAKEKESTKSSTNVTTAKRSDEEFRVPYEGTIVQNPSKPPSTGHPNTVMEPLAGTIERRPSKESEKKKPKNTSHKYSSKNTRENSNRKENQRESSYPVNLLESYTDKSKSDLLSGSKNNSTEKPSSPVNSNNSSSFEKTKSYSTTSIDLIKFNTSNKRDYEEKNKQNNAKAREEFVNKLKRPEKDLVYSVWLERKEEETADDKTS